MNTKIQSMQHRSGCPTVTIIDGPKFALEMSNCNSAAQVIGMLRLALREYEAMIVGEGSLRIVSVLGSKEVVTDHVILESKKQTLHK